MIIYVEGARNVGKTYMLNSIKNKIDLTQYKFPFVDFYNEYNSDNNKSNSDVELFYTTIGYDLTLLDLVQKQIIKENIIVDRGILSNIIFGIQSKRIDLDTGIKWWNYLYTKYSDVFKIVYLYSDINEDNRNKDMWSFYDIQETHNLYLQFFNHINYEPIKIHNKYNISSENTFFNKIKNQL